MPIDGDFAAIVLPSIQYEEVLKDPWGIQSIKNDLPKAGVNRYFVHAFMHQYFSKVPIFLQKFMPAVDSLYYSSAILKTILQILLLYLIASLCIGYTRFKNGNLWLCLLFAIPFFQIDGYHNKMGLINQSITYTCFYGLPLAGLLYFFIPYFRALLFRRKLEFTFFQSLIRTILILVLPFSGPLIAPLFLLLCPMIVLSFILLEKNKYQLSIRKTAWIILAGAFIFSLYSFFLGQYNLENIGMESMSVWMRYQKLPLGLIKIFSSNLGPPLLLLFIVFNFILIYKKYRKVPLMNLLKFVGIFCLLYLLLLPLGGFREYRPLIIRHDVFIPVSFSMIILAVSSSVFLWKKASKFYRCLPILLLLIFTIADISPLNKNSCEKNALIQLAESSLDQPVLSNECLIMSWDKINDPKYSKINAELLYKLGVCKRLKLFHQE